MNIESEDLPETWALATFYDLFDYIQRGKSPRYAETGSLPIINQKCVRWNGVQEEYVKFWDDKERGAITPERFLKPGDILWNSTGTGTIGRACLFHGLKTVAQVVADSHVTILRHNPNINPAYFFYFIMSPYVQRNIEAMQAGSTGQVELGREVIRTTKAPLAPLAEQSRIVEKIEELFSQIDAGEAALKKAQDLIKQYRQSLLKAAVAGELTKEWRKGIGAKGFKKSTLKELGSWTGGGTPSKQEPAYWIKCTIPWVSPKDMKVFRINKAEDYITKDAVLKSATKIVAKGSVLVVTRSGILSHTLPVAIAECPVAINQDLKALTTNEGVDSFFAAYLLLANAHLVLARYVKAGTTVANVNFSEFLDMPVMLPASLEEQIEIVSILDDKLASLDHLEKEVVMQFSVIRNQRQSILKAAFSGQLVPQDSKDEPASVLLERIKAERENAEASKTKRKAKINVTPKPRKRAAA